MIDVVVRVLLQALINDAPIEKHSRGLFEELAPTEQRNVLFSLLKAISELHLNTLEGYDGPNERAVVAATASVINRLVANDAKYMSHLVAWLTNATGAGLGDGIGIRRAVLAVLAADRDSIVTVFGKSLNQFGDFLYIKHTPMLQQEGTYDLALSYCQDADR